MVTRKMAAASPDISDAAAGAQEHLCMFCFDKWEVNVLINVMERHRFLNSQ